MQRRYLTQARIPCLMVGVNRVRRLVPSHATFVAYVALFVALGGASYAAIAIPRNSVGARQLKRNAVTSPKVKDHSLRAIDFAHGVLLAGPRGETGPRGPTGTVDTSQFYDKTASDARFLGAGATAANSAQLGGVTAGGYARGTGSITYMGMSANAGSSLDRDLPTAASSPLGKIHLTCDDPATSGSIRVDVPAGRTDVVVIAPPSGPTTAQLLTGPTSSTPSSLTGNVRVGLEVESSLGGVADKISADLYFVPGLAGNTSCSLVGFVTTNSRP
jgi:hypothetical protein